LDFSSPSKIELTSYTQNISNFNDGVFIMSNPRYFYNLTPDDLMKSKNQIVTEEGVVYSHAGNEGGINSLKKDLGRDVLLYGHDNSAAIMQMNESAFKIWIASQCKTPEIARLLAQHYSQSPGQFTLTRWTHSGSCGQNEFNIAAPQGKDRASNFYELDGSGYLKITMKRYPVHSFAEDGKIVGYINGPVEALFKLTEKGFELQHVSTDSALIRDMYLGEPVSRDEIVRQFNVDHLPERSILEIETTLKKQQKKLENWFRGKELTDQDTLGLKSLRGSLRAIQQYKTGKIDIEDLQTAVSTYLQQATEAEKALTPQKMSLPQRIISRLFSSPPTTKDILKKALKDIGYVGRAIVEQNNTGLRR